MKQNILNRLLSAIAGYYAIVEKIFFVRNQLWRLWPLTSAQLEQAFNIDPAVANALMSGVYSIYIHHNNKQAVLL
jgi:hypothetical protein